MFTLRGLASRGEQRPLQPLTLQQFARQLSPADRSSLAIFTPGRTRQVAADHALHGDHLDPLDYYGPSRDRGRHLRTDQMIRYDVVQFAQPPGAELSKDRSLVRDRRRQHPVEGRHVVGRHHQQLIVSVGRVELAHLPGTDEGQVKV